MVAMRSRQPADTMNRASRLACFCIAAAILVGIVAVTTSVVGMGAFPALATSKPFTGNDDPTLPKPWADGEIDWWSRHKNLVDRVKQSDALSAATDSNSPQLLFYGDSITEAWEGTSLGNAVRPTRKWATGEDQAIRDTFQQYFGAFPAMKPPLTLGVSGDQTQHLLWRLQNGELPSSAGDRIAVVMIGTNNIGGGTLPGPTLLGIGAVARYLLQHGLDLLLSELFPRHDTFRIKRLCPPRCNPTTGEAFDSFLPAIRKVNSRLPALVTELRTEFPHRRIAISSCGDLFGEDSPEIMPDQLHPNAKGHELWAKCLTQNLANLTSIVV